MPRKAIVLIIAPLKGDRAENLQAVLRCKQAINSEGKRPLVFSPEDYFYEDAAHIRALEEAALVRKFPDEVRILGPEKSEMSYIVAVAAQYQYWDHGKNAATHAA